MRQTHKPSDKWIADQFDSLDDLLALVQGKPVWSNEAIESLRFKSDNPEREKFTGTKSWEEAIGLAQKGWPEGCSKMVTNLSAAQFMQPGATYKAEALSVAGAYPLMPAAIAGEPDCMVTDGLENSATKPIYRFVVNTSFIAAVTPQQVMNRGAAILSWIDQLEAEGARIELICLRSCDVGRSEGVNRYSGILTLKRADEPLEIDRAAFAIAHPSMLRRIWFAALAFHNETEANFSDGLFKSSDYEPEQWKTTNSVYFGALREEDAGKPYNTMTTALKTIEGIIREGLSQDEKQGAEKPEPGA